MKSHDCITYRFTAEELWRLTKMDLIHCNIEIMLNFNYEWSPVMHLSALLNHKCEWLATE